jgi:hypothetical protein
MASLLAKKKGNQLYYYYYVVDGKPRIEQTLTQQALAKTLGLDQLHITPRG